MGNSHLLHMGGANVVALLRNVHTGEERIITGRNIITTEGDKWYAYKAGGSSSFTVAGLKLGSAGTACQKQDFSVGSPIVGGSKAIDAGYPKVSDDDADNSAYASANSNTWRVSFTTAEANSNDIWEGALVDSLTSPTKAVTHFTFAAKFNKTSSDTLKVFINHNLVGA